MKRIIIFLFIVFCYFDVFASSVEIISADEINSNEQFNFFIKANDIDENNPLLSFNLKIELDDNIFGNLQCHNNDSFIADDNGSFNGRINSDEILLDCLVNIKNDINALTNIKVLNTSTLNNELFNGISKELRIKKELSSNTKLNFLVINNVIFNEEFNSNLKIYTATVSYEVDQVIVQAQAVDSEASVIVTGATVLSINQENIIYVTVTAPNGDSEDYFIKIKRKAKEESINEKVIDKVSSKLILEKEKVQEKTIVLTMENNNYWNDLFLIFGGVLFIGLSGVACYIFFNKLKK